MITEWKLIEEYPNYEASTEGQIRNKKTLKILKGSDNNSGYLFVSLYRDKKSYNVYIHRAILITFRGNQEGQDVNHIDGNKKNNALSNLEWCSRSENMVHAITNSLYITAKGEKINNTVLTEAEVLEIRRLYNEKILKPKQISRLFKTTYKNCQAIIYRKSWRHI